MHVNQLTAEQRECYEERAAIIEYEGGLPRHVAEFRALLEVLGKAHVLAKLDAMQKLPTDSG